MQYQLAGTDPQGRLIYEPVNVAPSSQNAVQQHGYSILPQAQPIVPASQCSCNGCGHSIKKTEEKSAFASWFVVEQGVISLSLRGMTIFFSLFITAALVVMLYLSCNDGKGDYKCTI
jgi:hypothetical protein